MIPASARVAIFALGLALLSEPAMAQMMLPGANNGGSSGASPRSGGHGGGGGGGRGGGPPPAPMHPVFIKPPSDEGLIGHRLSRDGKSGEMGFDRVGSDLALSKLKLEGDKISKPQETCAVDVAIASPILTKPAGRPAGASRFEVPLNACPFTIDVLDGAVLVSRPDPSCDFKAADCRVTPGGLWGPAAAEITPKQAKDLERQRPRIETTMRTNYRALVKRAGKDRSAVKAIAREQAAFSSEREMTCRDYDKESVHGFCSTQITEARALALLAKFGPIEEQAAERRHNRPRPKPKPKPSADGQPAMPSPDPEDALQ